MKTYGHQKHVHEFYSSIIRNSQKVETPQMSLKLMNKENIVYTYNRVLFGNKNK